jgi:hypothetical protein
MHTLASIDVLDLDNPAAPAAYSVDGVDAKAATTNKPRHHDLTHRIFIHCCARQGACGLVGQVSRLLFVVQGRG